MKNAASFRNSFPRRILFAAGGIVLFAAFAGIITACPPAFNPPAGTITLSESNLAMVPGETAALTASVFPDAARNAEIVWELVDQQGRGVARVNDNGEVEALMVGIALISASIHGSGIPAALCKVEVNDRMSVTDVGIFIEQGKDLVPVLKKEMEAGQTITLLGGISPHNATNKKAIWTVEDWWSPNGDARGGNGVVRLAVDSETSRLVRVTAAGPGTALLRVETEEGGYAAHCLIIVDEPESGWSNVPEITSVRLNRNSLRIHDGHGGSEELIALVHPGIARVPLTWSSTDDKKVNVVYDIRDNFIVSVRVGTEGSVGERATVIVSADGAFSDACDVIITNRNGNVPVTGITLNRDEAKVSQHQSATFFATIEPPTADQRVRWEIDGNRIISITAGIDGRAVVIARAGIEDGDATNIHAVSSNPAFYATAKITVRDDNAIGTPTIVSNVNIAPSGLLTMAVGDYEELTATVRTNPTSAGNDNQGVTWESSAPGVASVNNAGHLTALTVGRATITVRSRLDPESTASLAVTVTPGRSYDVNSISINPSGLISMLVGDEQGITATVTITPPNSLAPNQGVIWTSNPPGIVSVSGGTLKALIKGEATITATATKDRNKSASLVVTVNEVPQLPASLSIAGNLLLWETLEAKLDPPQLPSGAFNFQWYRDGAPIPGATNQTFKLNETNWVDRNTQIMVQVTHSVEQGELRQSVAGPIGRPPLTGLVRMDGNAVVGGILTADQKELVVETGYESYVTFEWRRKGASAIIGTGKTFNLREEHVGHQIVLTAKHPWYTGEVTNTSLMVMSKALYVDKEMSASERSVVAQLQWIKEKAAKDADSVNNMHYIVQAFDNENIADKQDLTFDGVKNVTITLTSAGGPWTLSRKAGGESTGQLFNLGNGTTMRLSYITLKGLSSGATAAMFGVQGGTLCVEDGATLTGHYNSNDDGGGGRGGGIHLNSGLVLIRSGKIQDNHAHMGGGIYVTGGELRMESGWVYDNRSDRTSTSNGGGIWVGGSGRFVLESGEIYENKADIYGGGIVLEGSSEFIMRGGVVRDNEAIKSNGGGMFVGGGVFNMLSGEFYGNTANRDGGGVYVNGGGTFRMSGGTIHGGNSNMPNKAKSPIDKPSDAYYTVNNASWFGWHDGNLVFTPKDDFPPSSSNTVRVVNGVLQ